MVPIIKAHAVKNLCYIVAQKMVPTGIVVHSTGVNNPYLKRYVDASDEVGINRYGNHWNTAMPGGKKVCVHAFIGYDDNNQVRVAEILPLDICCWGVGNGNKGSYNYNPAYIQFEICEDKLTDKTYYNKAFEVAAEYCALLCQKYNIAVDRIVGHCEAAQLGYGSNHADPEHWMKNFGETMIDFRKKVSSLLRNKDRESEGVEESTSNQVIIQKGDLVSIASNATYYNGATIPSWVKSQNWYVKNNPVSNRVVIDKNEKGTNSICSPINIQFLSVVRKANSFKEKDARNEPNAQECPYLVKVTTSLLAIFQDADAKSVRVGTISDQGVYTIVATKMDAQSVLWGKLKSGVGWILLNQTKKI